MGMIKQVHDMIHSLPGVKEIVLEADRYNEFYIEIMRVAKYEMEAPPIPHTFHEEITVEGVKIRRG